MRIFTWLVRGLIFFTLFAFALNNQQDVVVQGFFGTSWRAPLVIVVLVAFAAGCAIGVVAMMPGWWRRRRSVSAEGAEPARPAPETPDTQEPTPTEADAPVVRAGMATVAHPPREKF